MPVGLRLAVYLIWIFLIGGKIFGGYDGALPGVFIMVVGGVVLVYDMFFTELGETKVDTVNGQNRDKRRNKQASQPFHDHHPPNYHAQIFTPRPKPNGTRAE